ncbi:MAG: glycerol-3-phosphate acyltransferase [Anaerolineales bacterium]
MLEQGLWIVFAFFLGSLPFSIWLGKIADLDPRRVGDGNPGTTNAWKVGGWRLGTPVIVLDFAKGFLPVALARWEWGWSGWPLVILAMAPVLGHRFSPFLRGRGGKAMMTLLAVWSGLTLWQAPLVVGPILTIGTLALRWRDGWVLLLSALVLLMAVLFGRWGGEALALWFFSALMIWSGYRHTLVWPPYRGSKSNA